MKEKPKNKVMYLSLIFVAVSLIVFTIVMIRTFREYGCIPDTLCTCVFSCLGGECGALAWIKTVKVRAMDREDRQTERRWQLNDYKRFENSVEPTNDVNTRGEEE